MLKIKRSCSYKIITRAVHLDNQPLVALLMPGADDCEPCLDQNQLQASLNANPESIIVYNQQADALALALVNLPSPRRTGICPLIMTRRLNQKWSVNMNFVKTTILGGLFVLLPIMLLWIGLVEIGGLLVVMATPIANILANWFPQGYFDNLALPGVSALVLIAVASLVLGLAARSNILSGIGRYIETAVLYKIPMYKMLKIMSGALIDSGTSDVNPALLRDGSGGGDPCYVIEKHVDGRATILLPWSPASFAGSIKVVQQSDLEILSCSLDEYSRSLSQVGVGIEECVTTKTRQN